MRKAFGLSVFLVGLVAVTCTWEYATAGEVRFLLPDNISNLLTFVGLFGVFVLFGSINFETIFAAAATYLPAEGSPEASQAIDFGDNLDINGVRVSLHPAGHVLDGPAHVRPHEPVLAGAVHEAVGGSQRQVRADPRAVGGQPEDRTGPRRDGPVGPVGRPPRRRDRGSRPARP